MNVNMTRRAFGAGIALGVLLPSVGVAKGDDYAFPRLLHSVADLLPHVSMGEDLRPAFEDDGMILIDVRERSAFDAGHIPGARHLDPNAVVSSHSPVAGDLRPEHEIVDMLERLGVSSTRRIVLYDDQGGFHAARMFWLLEYLGHRDVTLLNGGYGAWVAASGATTKQTIEMAAARFSPATAPRRLATAEYVLDQGADPSTVTIDVRPSDAFAKGHIPWGVNIPWKQNLGEDGLFLPADALRAHFEGNGVTPDMNIVIHCQVGLASSHSYVALRLLGYPRVRVYHRSWAEWGQDPTLPRRTAA